MTQPSQRTIDALFVGACIILGALMLAWLLRAEPRAPECNRIVDDFGEPMDCHPAESGSGCVCEVE